MQKKNYYRILGLSRDATPEQIKAAYRKLARKYHPDVSKEPEAETRFKEVAEAYEFLMDGNNRVFYDHLDSNWNPDLASQPPPGWDLLFQGGSVPTGGGRRSGSGKEMVLVTVPHGEVRIPKSDQPPQPQTRAATPSEHVTISLEEAYSGTTREITAYMSIMDIDGGSGRYPCKLKVKIPAGTPQGQQISLPGLGGASLGQEAASGLSIQVEFAPHPLFRAEGRDIFMDLPVATGVLVSGARLKVPTLGGWVGIVIPSEYHMGCKLRLRGRGLPGDPPGDQYILLKIASR
jgi:curved DNA-binding protein